MSRGVYNVENAYTRSTETDGSGTHAGADAMNCVPPEGSEREGRNLLRPWTGGSETDDTSTHAGADAMNCGPPFVKRRHPSRNSVLTYHDNRSIILFVTVVTNRRNPILANETAHDCIVEAWKNTTEWLVGRYIVMPDHVHFFCAPATFPPKDFHKWMKRWKALAALAYRRARGTHREGRNLLQPITDSTGTDDASTHVGVDAINCVPPASKRVPSLFQRGCWDRQLRVGESYAREWEYVRANPVRRQLVDHTDKWPYQGQLNVLEWHEKV